MFLKAEIYQSRNCLNLSADIYNLDIIEKIQDNKEKYTRFLWKGYYQPENDKNSKVTSFV